MEVATSSLLLYSSYIQGRIQEVRKGARMASLHGAQAYKGDLARTPPPEVQGQSIQGVSGRSPLKLKAL